MKEEIPIFKFALRSDLKDNKEFLPTRAEPKASGWDVRCAFEDHKPLTIRAGQYVKIPLGFRAYPDEGWWYELKPRSSTFAKKHLNALYGTIDETYENQLLFAAQYLPDTSLLEQDLVLNFGEPIGQIIPIKRQEMIVKEISNEEYDVICKQRDGVRKTGGFGSTG